MTNSAESYRPDYRYRRLSDISPGDIESWGVKAVGLDIDHTLCYDTTLIYISHAGRWLRQMKKHGIKMVIITNADFFRAAALGLRFNLPFVFFARKPKKQGFVRAADKLGLSPESMAFIGDRLSTDVLGANSVGAVSVYVEPPARDFLYFKNRSMRAFEKELFDFFDGRAK